MIVVDADVLPLTMPAQRLDSHGNPVGSSALVKYAMFGVCLNELAGAMRGAGRSFQVLGEQARALVEILLPWALEATRRAAIERYDIPESDIRSVSIGEVRLWNGRIIEVEA